MVGFGSTLRLARRPGWEGAYLDYERLKLLLSQIEVVYEEEGHDSNTPWETTTAPTNKGRQKKSYKQELFQESDSDAAFLSVEEDDHSDDDAGVHLPDLDRTPASRPFLSYSQQSSSDSEDDYARTSCLPGLRGRKNEPPKQQPAQQQQPTSYHHHPRKRRTVDEEQQDAFYNVGRTPGGYYDRGMGSPPPGTSLQYFNTNTATANESTSLLPNHSQPPAPGGTQSPQTNRVFAFTTEGNLTPPSHTYYQGGPTTTHTRDHSPNPKPRKFKKKKRRRRRPNKVPRHLRLAHSKARDITERFLGLMRAETEKVTLFAQSRLGELADTAGSLRFPSFDEELAVAPQQRYEFGDGGLHPSASSSSEDEFAPSDSSDDEDTHHSSSFYCAPGTAANTIRKLSEMHQSAARASPILPSSFSAVSDDAARRSTDTESEMRKESAARHKDRQTVTMVRRQIAQFSELRKNRSLFARNEQILGEDMLFLSVVEEADAYTAVGVELLHVLKYICVNLIAVRKICRKHDRLLMNRMLGGYYHRVRTAGTRKSFSHNIEEEHTLGGLIARVSADIYEAHPALIGQMNHYKLVGVYDKKIQKLANSRTVQVVSSCLALSLSEYEVTRSRANALTRLNSSASGKEMDELELNSDDESALDAPSTASTISLTRLRYTVLSIFSLREASRLKLNSYFTYLSRSSLTFTGTQVVGEGLEGCSRETLDFIVSYNPDSALLLDSVILFDGLRQNRWSRLPMGDVMTATLATASTPDNIGVEIAKSFRQSEERIVKNVVSIVPESKTIAWKRLMKGQLLKLMERRSIMMDDSVPDITMQLNRAAVFLYMMNYYNTHATTCMFVQVIGAPSAYSAALIGAPNVTAILISLIHCWLVPGESNLFRCRIGPGTIKGSMIFSSLMGIAGNAVHAVAIDRSSIPLAFVGRLLVGLSFYEILSREIMAACIPSYVVVESARLSLVKFCGIVAGLLVASAYIAVPTALNKLGHARQFQGPSWLMMILWVFHLFRVLVQVRRNNSGLPGPPKENSQMISSQHDKGNSFVAGLDLDDDSSSSDDIGTPSSFLYRSNSAEASGKGSLEPITSGMSSAALIERKSSGTDEQSPGRHGVDRSKPFGYMQMKNMGRIRKMLSFHIAIPVSLFVFAYATFGMEVMFTATPLVTQRYFHWSGAHSGTYLSILALSILPVTYACEVIARRYEERTVLKQAVLFLYGGIAVMLNYGSLFSLMESAPKLLTDTYGRVSHPYDWLLGVFQWTIGLAIFFCGIVGLEGASLVLLSKVSPARFFRIGTVTTFLACGARIAANLQIVFVDLSHKLINTDIVDSILIPLLLASFVVAYLVKQHFFFLM